MKYTVRDRTLYRDDKPLVRIGYLTDENNNRSIQPIECDELIARICNLLNADEITEHLFQCECGFKTNDKAEENAHKLGYMGAPDFDCPDVLCNLCGHTMGNHHVTGDCGVCGQGDPCGY